MNRKRHAEKVDVRNDVDLAHANAQRWGRQPFRLDAQLERALPWLSHVDAHAVERRLGDELQVNRPENQVQPFELEAFRRCLLQVTPLVCYAELSLYADRRGDTDAHSLGALGREIQC
jgi:hypothetical protein